MQLREASSKSGIGVARGGGGGGVKDDIKEEVDFHVTHSGLNAHESEVFLIFFSSS